MDVLFVGGLEFDNHKDVYPQYGQEILRKIAEKEFEAATVNFDAMIANGKLEYDADRMKMLDRATDYLVSLNSRIVGFYTICNSFTAVMELTRRLKARAPETKIFYGGPHATITAEDCLRIIPELELVELGESEYSILPMIKAMLDGDDYDEVMGIAYRKGSQVIRKKCYDLIPAEDLGNYATYDFAEDYPEAKKRVMLDGGRGCPFNCSFCSTAPFWGRKYRVKPVDVLIEEMINVSRDGNVELFRIQHDNFTVRKEYITEFCEKLISLGNNYHWGCSSRADCLDEELIKLMAKAGCVRMFLGIETGSPRMQKIIHKNLDIEDSISKVKMLVQNGIIPTTSLVYGFPEETPEDLEDTLKLLGDLVLAGASEVQLHKLFPLPATEETAKVYDRIYYDENDVDTSIYNREALTVEEKNLIKQYPELFMQFYTFDAETRKIYPCIESLSDLSFLSFPYYRGSLKYLIRKYGAKGLYLKYKDLACRIHKWMETYVRDNSEGREESWAIKEIVESENDKLLSDLFRFETTCEQYTKEGLEKPVLRVYGINVVHAENTGEITEKQTIVLFSYDSTSEELKVTEI